MGLETCEKCGSAHDSGIPHNCYIKKTDNPFADLNSIKEYAEKIATLPHEISYISPEMMKQLLKELLKRKSRARTKKQICFVQDQLWGWIHEKLISIDFRVEMNN